MGFGGYNLPDNGHNNLYVGINGDLMLEIM